MDYRVALDIYKGPLDLLLYLIQENEVDIYDIPIATITDQYMTHLEIIRMVDPNLAGDFLVMASTLMEIKSRMLLPRPEKEEGEEEEGDPRLDLIRQLMEYKKFKEAAAALAERHEEQQERFGRAAKQRFEDLEEEEGSLELSEVSIWDILSAFDRVMRETLRLQPATIVDRDLPVRQHVERILRMLRIQTNLTFLAIFETCEDRIEAVGALLALLEMARGRVITIEQSGYLGTILIRLADESRIPRLLQQLAEVRGDAGGAPASAQAAEEEPGAAEKGPGSAAESELPVGTPGQAPPEPSAAATPAAEAQPGAEEQEEEDEELRQIRRIKVHDVQFTEEKPASTEASSADDTEAPPGPERGPDQTQDLPADAGPTTETDIEPENKDPETS